jgi:hypothetical protein
MRLAQPLMRYLICKLTSHHPTFIAALLAGFNHYWKVPQECFIAALAADGRFVFNLTICQFF